MFCVCVVVSLLAHCFSTHTHNPSHEKASILSFPFSLLYISEFFCSLEFLRENEEVEKNCLKFSKLMVLESVFRLIVLVILGG